MKNIFFGLILMLSATAQAVPRIGGVDGGGGVGVRCPASSGAPKAFELLDLHEARLNGFVNPNSPQAETQSINLTVGLMANLLWNLDTIPIPQFKVTLSQVVTPMFEGGSWTDPDTGKLLYQVKYVQSLPLSTDIGNYRIVPGCQLEQIAYFDDATATLSIADNWNDLDWVDRAALVTHELAYYMDRHDAMEYFSQNVRMTSERARALVGQLFSTVAVTPHADSLPASGYVKCADSENNDADTTYSYFFDDGAGNAVGIFNVIHGRDSMYQLKATFPGVGMQALTDLDNGVLASTETMLQFSSEVDAPIFVLKIAKQAGSPLAFDVYENQSGSLVSVAPTQALSCWNP